MKPKNDAATYRIILIALFIMFAIGGVLAVVQ